MSSDFEKREANFADYFFFLRPMLHPPVWTIVILGYYRAADGFSFRLVALLLTSSAAAAWAYIVNQLSDIESDRLNHKLFFLAEGIITQASARFMAAFMLIITVVGGFALGPFIGILFAAGLGLGYAYSASPFNWKAHPLAGILSNGIAHGILPFAAGYIVGGGEATRAFLYSIPYFVAVSAVFIGTTIPDREGDRKIRKITPAVWLRSNNAAALMALLTMAAATSAWLMRDPAIGLAALGSLPFYILNWRRVSDRQSAMAVKVSILFLSLAAAWFFPPYLILAACLILVTRLYYRRRFKMTYPTLA